MNPVNLYRAAIGMTALTFLAVLAGLLAGKASIGGGVFVLFFQFILLRYFHQRKVGRAARVFYISVDNKDWYCGVVDAVFIFTFAMLFIIATMFSAGLSSAA